MPDPQRHDFSHGAAVTGWCVIIVLAFIAFIGIVASYSADQYIAGGIGAGIVIIGLACGAEY